MRYNHEHRLVIERIDGATHITRLPKEQAEKLYRKIRSKGGKVDIQKETLKC